VRLGILVSAGAEQAFVVERHGGEEVQAAFDEIVVLEGNVGAKSLLYKTAE